MPALGQINAPRLLRCLLLIQLPSPLEGSARTIIEVNDLADPSLGNEQRQ